MAARAVYARLQPELHEKVQAHAEATGQSLSSAIEELVQHGLGELSSEGRAETLAAELASFKDRVAEREAQLASVDGERRSLLGRLEAYRAKESIALAAGRHAQTLHRQAAAQAEQLHQLRSHLTTAVAVCRNCSMRLRLYDIGQRRCSSCGQWNFRWLTRYTPPSPMGEALSDGAVTAGAAAIVAGLLDALGDPSES